MEDIKLTEKDRSILQVLKVNPRGLSPTILGQELGKSYHKASAYCNGSLKKLVRIGLVKRIINEGVKYSVTK